MGATKFVSATKYPVQGNFLGKDIKVMFDYDSSMCFSAKCIRDDMAEPFLSLFQLMDGRVVRATECQYSPTNRDPDAWVKWDGAGTSPLPFDSIADVIYLDGTVDYDRDSNEIASLFGVFDGKITLDYETHDDSIGYYRITS